MATRAYILRYTLSRYPLQKVARGRLLFSLDFLSSFSRSHSRVAHRYDPIDPGRTETNAGDREFDEADVHPTEFPCRISPPRAAVLIDERLSLLLPRLTDVARFALLPRVTRGSFRGAVKQSSVLSPPLCLASERRGLIR